MGSILTTLSGKLQSKHKRKGKNPNNRPTTPIMTPAVPPKPPIPTSAIPTPTPTPYPAPYRVPSGNRGHQNCCYPHVHQTVHQTPAPLTNQKPLQRPTPLMEIYISKPHNFTPKAVYALHPTHSLDAVKTQCQLCLGWGHSMVTCKSKDTTSYSCGKVGHFQSLSNIGNQRGWRAITAYFSKNCSNHRRHFYPRPVWPSGIVVACVCLSVRVSITCLSTR